MAIDCRSRASADAGLMLDSGSEVHACPLNFSPGSPTGPSTLMMRDIQGNYIDGFGTRDVRLTLGNQETSQKARISFEVGAVIRPLLSLGKLVEAGYQVSLKPKGSEIVHPNGSTMPITQQGHLFFLPIKSIATLESDKENIKSIAVVEDTPQFDDMIRNPIRRLGGDHEARRADE